MVVVQMSLTVHRRRPAQASVVQCIVRCRTVATADNTLRLWRPLFWSIEKMAK